MNAFSYHNIFETKGIEYLVVIAFLLLLVPFWIMLNKRSSRRRSNTQPGRLTEKTLKIPQGILFNRNHTWTYLTMSGTAKVGLNDMLLHITGDISFPRLKDSGTIRKGEILTEIVQNGKTLRIYSPVSGEIVAANTVLEKEPFIVCDDPYGAGWVYKIKPSNWSDETRSYFLAAEATTWFGMELQRFRDFLSKSAAQYNPGSKVVLQDGGELTDTPMADMPPEMWSQFQHDFLDPQKI
jgi:glycine cleavage system H protein